MSTGVREETANTALSLLLNEYGMESTSLIQLGRDIPDVYLVERGVRCILEMKRESNRGELPSQMGDRLDDGVCEVVFGIVFPDKVTTGGMAAPTVTEVKQNLRDANLDVLVQAVSSDHELASIENVSTSRLPANVDRRRTSIDSCAYGNPNLPPFAPHQYINKTAINERFCKLQNSADLVDKSYQSRSTRTTA